MNSINSTPRSWSPEKELWSALNRISEDTTWSFVKFDENSGHVIPSKSKGVYLICADTPRDVLHTIGLRTVLYAGKSESCLKTRFLRHIRSPTPKLKMYLESFISDTFFYYSKMVEISRIGEIENLLIQTFNPPCNSISGPGTSHLLARLGPPKEIGARFHVR